MYYYRVTNLGSQAPGGITVNDGYDQVAGAAVEHYQVSGRTFAKGIYHARNSRLVQLGAEPGGLTQMFDAYIGGQVAKMVDMNDLTTPASFGARGLGQVK